MTSPDTDKMVGELGDALGIGWNEGVVYLMMKDWVEVLQGSYMRDLTEKDRVPKSS